MSYKKKHGLYRRATSALLAVIMMLGLVPAGLVMPSAAAATAPDSITLSQIRYPSKSGGSIDERYYQSAVGLGKCWLHTFQVTANGSETLAFCADHDLTLNSGHIKKQFKNPQKVDRNAHPVMCAFLDIFYERSEKSAQLQKDNPGLSTEELVAKYSGYWTQFNRDLYNCVYQAAVWMDLTGKFSGMDISNPVDRAQINKLAAKEMARVGYTIGAAPGKTEAELATWYENEVVQWVIARYFSEPGPNGNPLTKFPERDYYIYDSGNSSLQRLLTSIPSETPPADAVYITLDKVDENANPLSGATFEVYADSSCNQKIGDFMTGASSGLPYGPFRLPGGQTTGTLYLKETKAPAGKELGAMAGRILSVQVDSAVNTEDNPAKVLGGPFENGTEDHTEPDAVIRKVDAKTGQGIGPATFHIEGKSHIDNDHRPGAEKPYPEVVDMRVPCDKNGNLKLQWYNPNGDNYIPVGTYTVTEITPPPGYERDPNPQTLNLEITPDGQEVSSGPLTFKNYKKHTIELLKVDESGKGLAGAVFEVFCNDQSLGSYTTDGSGRIILDGNGQGLQSGFYELVETKAPEGYLLPYRRVHRLYIDAEMDPATHTVSVANYKYPEIRIKKTVAGTGEPLAGALFEIKIDGRDFGTKVTGDGGEIVIDFATYARFLDEDPDAMNRTFTVMAREVKAPDGYLIDDDNWHTAEIVPGQKLAPLEFTDTAYPKLVIRKYENGTKKLLPGATFAIRVNGKVLEDSIKNETGELVIDFANYGEFLKSNNLLDKDMSEWGIEVKELTAPDGYLLDDDNWQTASLDRGEKIKYFDFEDTPYPEIKILKLDRETLKPLPGTTFSVAINGVGIEGPLVTDENGIITITYEQYARYLGDINGDEVSQDGWAITVTELEMPEKYNKDRQEGSEGGDGYTITKHLQPDQKLIEFTFKDTHYRDVRVIKRDASNTWLLEGTTFHLESINLEHPNEEGTKITREGRTDANGQFIFKDLPNGTYRITEIIPPVGYEKADPDHLEFTITSMSDRVIDIEFKNAPKQGILITKHDAITGKALAGTKFSVRYLGEGSAADGITNAPVEYITDVNGTIYLPDRKAGFYEIRETAVPDGYILDPEPRIIEVVDQHGSYVVDFRNYQDTQLIVLKEDAQTGLPLAGARFTITTAGGNWIADIVTGPMGYATLAGMEPGAYVITEVEAPDGHLIDPVPQTFEIRPGQTEPIFKVFKNNGKINLYIRKEDEQTRLPLEGAVFTLRRINGETIISRVETEKDGLARITDLEPGDYEVEEIEAPQGYILSNNPKQTISLKAGTTASLLFRNNKRGGIAILKQDAISGLPLAGAEFSISDVDHKPLQYSPFTTGLDGYIRVNDLPTGYYFIKETKAPEGYLLDPTEHQVFVEDFKVTLVELTNYEESTFVVNKVDAQSKVPLAGAKFGVFSLNGTQQGDPFVTDASGKARLTNLNPGWYILRELEAPQGYVRNEQEYRIEIIDGQPASLTVPNVPESGITVHKVDAVTHDPLAGADFELRTHDGKLVGSYTTDVSGSFITENVEPGIYYLRETRAPDGYTPLTEDTEVTVIEGEHPVITIENHKDTTIELQKVDAVTGKYLEGAVFDVWTLNCEKLLGTYTTGPSGIVFTEPLPAGNYIVTEHKAPDGYITTDEHFHVQVLYDHPAILKVANNPLTGIMITKLSSVDDQPLVGAKFEIRTAEGKVIGEFATDTAGDPTIAVEPGVYYVHETKAPDGYLLNEEVFRVEVEAGKIVPLVVRDDPEPSLVIYKGDKNTGKGIPGAIFKVETANGDFIGQYTTDAQGEALIRPIKPGHYVVKEMSAPEGYELTEKCSKTITVKVGVINRVEFFDAEKGSLVVRLEDQKDGHRLENGRFELYWAADGRKVAEGVTDNSGSIVWGTLDIGDYIIKQTYAPDGYTMVDVELRATVISGETVIVVFKDCTSGLVIEKVDRITKETLPGARFKVVRDTDNIVIGEYVTGEDGLALVSGLIPGMYTVEELVAPTNYEIDNEPQLVHVKANENAHVTFEDTPYAGITINLVDKTTNEPIPGITVEIWHQNGELINTYTSDNTGIIQTDKLPSGMYVIKVVNAVSGYTAVTTEQTVEVKDGVQVTVKFEFVASGTLQILGLNTDETGLTGMKVKVTTINGTVIGEYTTDVTGTIRVPSLDIGWYVVTVTKAPDGYTASGETSQNVEITSHGDSIIKFYFGKTYGVQIQTSVSQTGVMVAGVKYQITKLDGSIVGEYTSDAAGLLYVQLEPGWYVIKMTELPAGYQGYTLCPGRNVEVVAGKPTVVNFVLTQLSSIRVKVIDGSSNKPLYGVNLLLKDAAGAIVDQYATNNEGYITLKNTLVNGTYTLTMITAPSGYTVDPTPKTIEVLNGETTEIVWRLFNQAGQIQVHLTSSEYNATLDKAAGANLQGAVFEIYDPFTYVVLATIETDSYGVAASTGLPIGRYIIREKSPAPYYGMSGKETEVYIKINNDVVRVEYQAAPLNLKVGHAINGISNISAGSFGKFIFTKVNNESSSRMDNFFWTVKIPTDAVRAGTLFTGKWSADVKYTISYKTNMNDYRILAKDLSSATPYQYDLSSLAMSNQGGEYVTDIRFEFGTVPANFKVVTSPIFYNYVMPTLPNNFLVITRSECGGKVGDAWKTESALWTTTVLNKGGAGITGGLLPNKLPKTGY